MDDPLHEDPRQVHLAGIERVDNLFYLGDGHPAGHRAQRVEVLRGGVEAQVAEPVADGGVDQREIGDDRLFEDVGAVAETARLPLGEAVTTAPPASWLQGSPPWAIWVPTPAGV